MAKVIDTSKTGIYTLEQLVNGNYVIVCDGNIMRRHGEYKDLESAMWRWPCYMYS